MGSNASHPEQYVLPSSFNKDMSKIGKLIYLNQPIPPELTQNLKPVLQRIRRIPGIKFGIYTTCTHPTCDNIATEVHGECKQHQPKKRGRSTSSSSSDSESSRSSSSDSRSSGSSHSHASENERSNKRVIVQDHGRPRSTLSTTSSRKSTSSKYLICKQDGCKNKAVTSNGLCRKHGGPRCQHEQCSKPDHGGGFCSTHGGGTRCKQGLCNKLAKTGGLCQRHGGGKKCSIETCDRYDRGGGLCAIHAGKLKCKVKGCRNPRMMGGKCHEHGGGKTCEFSNCSLVALSNGMCRKHGGILLCEVESCTKRARIKRKCQRHYTMSQIATTTSFETATL